MTSCTTLGHEDLKAAFVGTLYVGDEVFPRTPYCRDCASGMHDEFEPDPLVLSERPLLRLTRSPRYGWSFDLTRRLRWSSTKATTRAWPRLRLGADENCNRALTYSLWPLGQLDVWWEPLWRNERCLDCRLEDFQEETCDAS